MKVILMMATSLNGIIATSDDKEDFLSHENWNQFVKRAQKSGCLIWGRKTYELVRNWGEEYLKSIESITKIIISSNPHLKLDESFTLAESPQKALVILINRGFKEVILTGGSTNNSSFAKLGLIDEVLIDLNSVIIGKGISLFNPEEFELKLELIKNTKINKDIVELHYKVIK